MGYQRGSAYVGTKSGEGLLRFPVTTELKGKEELAKEKIQRPRDSSSGQRLESISAQTSVCARASVCSNS